MNKLGMVLLAGALSATLISCGGTLQTAAPQQQTKEATKQETPKPKINNAVDVVNALKQSGFPIGDQDIYTAEKDPNKLMGRPGQYTSKVNFKDITVKENGKSIEVINGGSVEMFDNEVDAKTRFEYVSKIAKSAPAFNEYDYQEGKVLLRISRDFTPDNAKKYDDALKKILK